jgi:hypothetical protein
MMAVALLALAGCDNSSIEDLTGKYPISGEYSLSTLKSMNIEKKSGGIRVVSLELTGGSSTLNAALITNEYYLRAGSYIVAPEASAQNGNYIAEKTFFSATGGAAEAVVTGTIVVTIGNDSPSSYTIGGTLQLADNTFVRVDWSGKIEFVEDPPVVTYKLEVAAPYAWTTDGYNYTSVEGSQLNKFTVYSDGVLKAYFEIVTAADPASFSKTYPVSGEIRDAGGAVVKGIYMDLSQYNMGIIEGGSYLIDEAGKAYINAGSITITDTAGVLTFKSSNLEILDKTSLAGVSLPGTRTIDFENGTKE